jgi:N-acetylglucosamine-6-sulfatase
MLIAGPALVRPPAPVGAPNIVILLTDDQRTDSLSGMPAVQSLLVRRGRLFTQAMVPTSACCPSRASLLTGLYAHDTGVWSNRGRWGGWTRFAEEDMERRTIATALDDRGYLTAFLGKYLNGFGRHAPVGYTPVGWDYFAAFSTKQHSGAYYNYSLADGSVYGSDARSYSTDVLARKAVRVVRTTAAATPIFLYFAPYAPHSPFTPPPRYLDSRSRPAQDRPLTSEDRSQMPSWVRSQPPAPVSVTTVHDRQDRTLRAVDDAVASIVRVLAETHRLKNTLFVFMSDNGLMRGEHGLTGKNVPYRSATSVPMVIRWDGRVPAGGQDNRLALNLDVAQTISAAANVDFHSDGLDLLGPRRRAGFVLEASRKASVGRPAYCGWRTHRFMFARYADGEEELYDYRTDPAELKNRVGDPAYSARLTLMRTRAREHCRPTPPGYSWS